MALGEDVCDYLVGQCPGSSELDPLGFLDGEGVAGAFTDEAAFELREASDRVGD